MKHRTVADISRLPTYDFGASTPMWWGTLAFIALEATGFALAIGAYLYLASVSPQWPIAAPPPDLFPGTAILVVLLISVVPNHMVEQLAKRQDLAKVRVGMIVMSAVGFLPLLLRIWEFAALEIRWDQNAYGSIIWFIIGLHTTHLLTDVGDTVVLAVLMFTDKGNTGRRFSDVADNAFYWDFVVASWVVLYFIIYWFPRM
ncbi:cytochrome C oxidase subunit III [Mesorhizobium sp. B2-4-14]|uniref:cytochrome c oxidase subunit 3 n=1 Tax=Mesorhizobium sp. B2-4-14 TaxID=2589935 RepID=UPI0011291FA3|nr:cytochrome c oxidase subunit 3 [Mesorhizobium sp. B2-4-14]TPL12404.1 cytochrome C oxidase subunit III [Mesorhizobium sp. B2-4-14]